MPLIDNAKLKVRAAVPPGDSLVGVYPLCLFRIDRFHLPVAPGLALMHGGTPYLCDGQVVANRSSDRTLCVGNFFALHVRNSLATKQELELTVSGPTVDGPEEQDAHVVLGTFAMEVEEPGIPLADVDTELGLPDDYGDYSQADGKGLP
jgi:hypothetical protein